MAIHWNNSYSGPYSTHAGLVVSSTLRWDVDNRPWIKLWNPILQQVEPYCVEGTNTNEYTGSDIDIDPDLIHEWAVWQEFQGRLETLLGAEESAKTRLQTPKLGSRVVVRKGRKVPVGREGVVFSLGPDHFRKGIRLGIREDSLHEFWISAENVEVLIPGLKPGQMPVCGWSQLERELEKVNPSRFVMKGDKIRHMASGQEGRVFFSKNGRLGYNIPGPKSPPLWASEAEVAVFRSGLWEYNQAKPYTSTPLQMVDMTPSLVANFPEPLNQIAYIEVGEDGSGRAYSSHRVMLTVLPVSVVVGFWAKNTVVVGLSDRNRRYDQITF